VKTEARDTYVISLANGELQGYITTEAAAAEGGYEASNSIFAPQAGRVLVEATLLLIGQLKSRCVKGLPRSASPLTE
jgi:hypothetical protein